MSGHNLPKEPGFYWATDKPDRSEWNIIARFYGNPLFLRCCFWRYSPVIENINYHNFNGLYFGPKIEMPERDPRAIFPN